MRISKTLRLPVFPFMISLVAVRMVFLGGQILGTTILFKFMKYSFPHPITQSAPINKSHSICMNV